MKYRRGRVRASEALDATDMDWAMKGRRRSGWKEPRRRHGWTSQWRGMMCDTTAFSSEGTKKAPLSALKTEGTSCPQARDRQTDRMGGGALAQLNPPSGPYTIQINLIPRFGSD
jgi:hypothetical protein